MADETAAAETNAPEMAEAENNGAKRKLLRILAIVVVTVAVLWGLWYFPDAGGACPHRQRLCEAPIRRRSPRSFRAGQEVRVSRTQAVKKGDILVILDDADQRIAVADAEAALQLAPPALRAGRRQCRRGARARARGADIAQARARLRDANATVERARRDGDVAKASRGPARCRAKN